MILVIGHLSIDPRERDRACELMRPAVVAARATEGCLDFATSPDIVEPGRVNIFERWTDRDSLERFRADGPENDLDELILAYSVEEYEL